MANIFAFPGRLQICLSGLMLVMVATLLPAQSSNVFPEKPDPAVYVHDYSGWLSAGEKQTLENKLQQYW